MEKPPLTDEMTVEELADEHRERVRGLRRHYRKANHPIYRSREENEELLNLMRALYGDER